MTRVLPRLALVIAVLAAPLAALAASPGQAAADRGAALYRAGEFEKAREAYREAVRLDPAHLVAWESLGWAEQRLGNAAEARRVWENLLRLDPNRASARRAIASLDKAKEDAAAAERLPEAAPPVPLPEPKPKAGPRDERSAGAAGAREKARPRGERGAATARAPEEKRARGPDAAAERPDGAEKGAPGAARPERAPPEETPPAARARTPRAEDPPAGETASAVRPEPPAAAKTEPPPPPPEPDAPAGSSGPEARASAVARAAVTRGDAALRDGDVVAAERAFREALAALPGDPWILTRLGRTAARAGRRDEALALWSEAARVPEGPPEVHGYLALAYHERGDRERARAAYERGVAVTPQREPWPLFHLAETALALGDDAGAERALATLFALPKLHESWSRRVADLFLRRASAARGVAFFTGPAVPATVPGRTPALSRLLSRAGGDAFRADRLEEAARAFSAAVALDPKDRSALRDLGWTYRRMERWEDAERTWKRYAEAYPALADPHDLLTGLYLDQHEFAPALAAARRSLAIDPGQKGAIARTIRSLFGLSRLAEALQLAERHAARHPDDPQAQRLYADALTKARRLPEAARQWERLVALQPGSPAAKQGWVQALHEAGETGRAVAMARQMARSPDAPAGVLELIASDAVARGDLAEAERWYRALTERFPRQPLFWRRRANTLDQLGRFGEQLEVAREAARRFPDRAEIQLDLVTALGNAGRIEEAVEHNLRYVETFPENRAASHSLVQLLVADRRPAEALRELSKRPPSFYTEIERRMIEATLRAKLGDESAAARLLRELAEPPPGRRYVPILLYHGVVEHAPTLQITQRAFEGHMAALAAAGYEAITVTELARMIDGEVPFPAKPILITFDDARGDTFAMADPVLARHGHEATMFVPTGRIGPDDGFHAGWETIVRHARSGRWDMQAHGHDAHDQIPIDGDGQRGHFLSHRAWLPAEGRPESFGDFVARLDEDYRVGKRELEERFPSHPIIAYAFPLSQVGQDQPGEQRPDHPLNEDLASRHYRFGFVQDASGYNALGGAKAPFLLRRFEPPSDWTGERLLVHLARQEPRTAALLELARLTLEGGRPRAARRIVERLAREEPLVAAECEKLLAHVSWHERRPRDAADHLAAAARNGPEPSLDRFAARLAWKNDPRGSFDSTAFGDSDGRTVLGVGTTMRQPLPGNVDLELGFSELRLAERGLGSLVGPQLSAGASATIGREIDVSGWGRYRALSTVPETLEGGAEIGLRLERHSFVGQWSYESVDTVLGRRAGIERHAFLAGYAYASRRWRAAARGGRLEYDDLNVRVDYHASLMRVFGEDQRWALGASVDYDDARFDPEEYWTPDRLLVAMGKLRYARGWGNGSSFSLETGVGAARDPVRDLRPSGLARLRLFHAFGGKRNFAAGINAVARAVPGYRSIEGTFRLEMRF